MCFLWRSKTWNHLRPASKRLLCHAVTFRSSCDPERAYVTGESWWVDNSKYVYGYDVNLEKNIWLWVLGFLQHPFAFLIIIVISTTIYYNIVIIIDGFLLYDFQWKTRDTSVHARHISWIVLSPVPRWHRSPGAALWVLSQSLRHRQHPHRAKKGAETGRLEKWGQRERKNQLINNWKERLEESKKINEMEWAKKGLEQKMLALVGRRMDPHARMDKMDKESHKMPTESCILWAKLRDHHTPQRRHRWQKTSWDTPACWIHTQIYTWFIWYSFNLIHVSFDQMIRKFRKDTRISTRWPGGSGGCGTLCIAFDLWRSLRFLESLEKTNPRMKKMEKCHKMFIA